MNIKSRFPCIGLLVAASLLLFSVAFHAAVPAVSGEAIYTNNCMMCHGADGKGFPALKTPDFTDPKWQSSNKDKQIGDVIKNGKKGTMMAAFGNKLNDQEITAVIAYIRSLKKK